MSETTHPSSNEKMTAARIWDMARRIPPIFPVFILVFVGVGLLNPNFLTLDGFLQFLRRASPLVILALGQLFVIVVGGFDLSVGSLVSFVVIAAALLIDNDPTNLARTLIILTSIGILVGLVNGFSVSYMKVPSLIATLGMMLVLRGAGLYWSGGAPRGYLTENFRMFGRGFINDIPVIGRFPYAVIILVVIGFLAYYVFHHTNLGRQIKAVGDNPTAAGLSGIRVRRIRMIAFVVSSVFAIIAGVMVGGFGGVTTTAGDGLEMQSISAAVLGGAVLVGRARFCTGDDRRRVNPRGAL
jgi:ribose transport system permease protein